MTLLKVLATTAGPDGLDPQLVLDASIDASIDAGDHDAMAVAIRHREDPDLRLAAALLSGEPAPLHQSSVVAAVRRWGWHEQPDQMAALLTTVGLRAARSLLNRAAAAARSGYRDHPDMTPTLTLLVGGLPQTLRSVDTDLRGWVELASETSRWRRGQPGGASTTSVQRVAGRWCQGTPTGTTGALPLWALSNPHLDDVAIETVAKVTSFDAEPSEMAAPVAAAPGQSLARLFAEAPRRLRWLIPAAVIAERTDWLTAAQLIAAADETRLVADHVTRRCVPLTPGQLRTMASLERDWTGTFDELLAAATELTDPVA